MKKYIFILILLHLILGCTEESEIKRNIKIVTDDFTNLELIDDLFTIKEVDIEDKAIDPFRWLSAFSVDSDDNIYVVADRRILYKFNSSGKYIGKLKKIGRGVGKYVQFNSFLIDEEQNIYIDNPHGGKILVYDKNFNFLYDIKNDAASPLRQFNKKGDKIIGFAPLKEGKPIFIYDTITKTQVEQIGEKNVEFNKYGRWIFGGGFDVYQDKIYYVFPEQYQIFVIENGKTKKLLNNVPLYFDIPKEITNNIVEKEKIPIVYSINIEKDYIILCYTTDKYNDNHEKYYDILTLNGEIIKSKLKTKFNNRLIKYANGKYLTYKIIKSENGSTLRIYLLEMK